MPSRIDHSLLPVSPDFSFETALWEQGFQYIAGVDEVGRGALAGPVAAAAVVLPTGAAEAVEFIGIKDSKQLSAEQRRKWSVIIRKTALAWEVGLASNTEIDAIGIVPATQLAMRRAINRLRVRVEYILIDYVHLPEIAIPQESLVKGDERSASIASASIMAKVARDAILCELDCQYPGYSFAQNKGYGTQAHRIALSKQGLSPVHRRCFQVKETF
jgi:ribonuclease HII